MGVPVTHQRCDKQTLPVLLLCSHITNSLPTLPHAIVVILSGRRLSHTEAVHTTCFYHVLLQYAQTIYQHYITIEVSLYGSPSDTPAMVGLQSETHFRRFCNCTLHHLGLVQTHLQQREEEREKQQREEEREGKKEKVLLKKQNSTHNITSSGLPNYVCTP